MSVIADTLVTAFRKYFTNNIFRKGLLLDSLKLMSIIEPQLSIRFQLFDLYISFSSS